jgi:hypothetical protein
MYGENMYAKHTFFYDALPSYFLEFDIFDKETGNFLSTSKRRKLLGETLVAQVPVLHEGPVKSVQKLGVMISRSKFISPDRRQNLLLAAEKAGVPEEQVLRETDMSELMEGLYVKIEDDENEELDNNTNLENITTNAPATCEDINISKEKTKPKPYYTIPSLLKDNKCCKIYKRP